MSSSWIRWSLLTALALAAILIPFALFEAEITAWTNDFLRNESSRWAAAGVLAALLASDVLLPIPSSLVSTAAGYLLGLAGGAAVSWAGMSVGALIGYYVGRSPARLLTRKLVGEEDLRRAEAAHARYGDWAIIACRSVPVLAEASVVFAGVTGMPLRRFLTVAALSNLGISLVYAAVGAYALEAESFLLAFGGAIVLPGVAMLVAKALSLGRGRS